MSLADGILILHAAIAVFIVGMVPMIALGGWLKWRWVRIRWLRFLHLGAMAFVLAETLIGVACPLTVWESNLRRAAGEAGYAHGFIADWAQRLLFWDLPHWAFPVIYATFFATIVLVYWLVPPARRA